MLCRQGTTERKKKHAHTKTGLKTLLCLNTLLTERKDENAKACGALTSVSWTQMAMQERTCAGETTIERWLQLMGYLHPRRQRQRPRELSRYLPPWSRENFPPCNSLTHSLAQKALPRGLHGTALALCHCAAQHSTLQLYAQRERERDRERGSEEVKSRHSYSCAYSDAYYGMFGLMCSIQQTVGARPVLSYEDISHSWLGL